MPTSAFTDLATVQDTMAAHACSAFGMPVWVADAYAQIATAAPPDEHSATATLRACSRLTQDDSGSVDPLAAALAREVLRLNKTTVALTPNTEATMHTVLDLLGLKYAEPEEQAKLLATLGSYLENHEFAEDENFRRFAKVVESTGDIGFDTSTSP